MSARLHLLRAHVGDASEGLWPPHRSRVPIASRSQYSSSSDRDDDLREGFISPRREWIGEGISSTLWNEADPRNSSWTTSIGSNYPQRHAEAFGPVTPITL